MLKNMAIEIHLMSDEELYTQCQEYGALSLYYRRKFIGLLPEVNRRRLFERHGFSSIFEFGFKLAGLSEEQIKLTLRLKERFEERPILKSLLESGAVSINKLARIASLTTPENEEFWANQVQNLSNRALEVLVKDEKSTENENVSSINSMHVHDLKLSDEVLMQLFELQEKGIDVNQLILEFLRLRKEEIEQEKQKLAGEKSTSRYIPARTKKLLKKEHGVKCAIPHCKKLAEEIHHTDRYSLSKSHNPYYLAPLCKQHHQIAHSIDQNVLKHRKPGEPPGRPPPSPS